MEGYLVNDTDSNVLYKLCYVTIISQIYIYGQLLIQHSVFSTQISHLTSHLQYIVKYCMYTKFMNGLYI
jgi:hypothetical protein